METILESNGVDLSGWKLTNATAISDDGLVVAGWGYDPQGYAQGWIATVPEPRSAHLRPHPHFPSCSFAHETRFAADRR